MSAKAGRLRPPQQLPVSTTCRATRSASRWPATCRISWHRAWSASGERYADSENAFSYRKALRADCTCNGRHPTGLAPIDLTLDTSLRPGDVIATTDGLVAYSGVKVGVSQTVEFIPVASYPGLTAEVRARLGEMKVAPVPAEMIATDAALPEASRDVALPVSSLPNNLSTRTKRAEVE